MVCRGYGFTPHAACDFWVDVLVSLVVVDDGDDDYGLSFNAYERCCVSIGLPILLLVCMSGAVAKNAKLPSHLDL